MDPRCVLAVNWLLFRVGLRVSRNLCELGPAQFVGAFLFIFNGPWCFAARTYSSSFSQYLGSRGSLAEYETASIFRQFLLTTPRSPWHTFSRLRRDFPPLKTHTFWGECRRRGSRPCRISCVFCVERGFFCHHLDTRWLSLHASLPE